MKKIEIYKYDYCNYTNNDSNKVLKHEKQCLKNINIENCINCKYGNKTYYGTRVYRCNKLNESYISELNKIGIKAKINQNKLNSNSLIVRISNDNKCLYFEKD